MLTVSWGRKRNNELSWSEKNKLRGSITFVPENDHVLVNINISGLSPNTMHGFHIHEKRLENAKQLSHTPNCCDLLGGHFNPYNKQHGSIWNEDPENRHVGDLCNNIHSNENGEVNLSYLDDQISLNKAHKAYIGDRSVVIHKYPDDLGRMGFQGKTYVDMSDDVLKFYGRVDKNGNVKNRNELMELSVRDGNAGFRIACGNLSTVAK